MSLAFTLAQLAQNRVELSQLVTALARARDAGVTREEAYQVATELMLTLREAGDEAMEDRLLEAMDEIVGFNRTGQSLWSVTDDGGAGRTRS